MDLYWLYDLSTPLLFVIIVGAITISGLTKTLIFPHFFKNALNPKKKHNDFTIGFLSLTGSFLSITIGLIIVGTYENYESCEKIVKSEVSSLYYLYKSVNYLEGEEKNDMSNNLRDYADFVLNKEWAQQQNGLVPQLGIESLNDFEERIFNYEPRNDKDQIVYIETLSNYKELIKYREERIFSVNEGLPISIYTILVLGLLINIAVSWQIVIDNKRLELFIYTLTGILAGSLVFIIIAMDNPYRGEFSVSADSFKLFLDSIAN